jgi:hydrogenase maturation protein HypF
VAALLGIRQRVQFEGQAAMELEFVIGQIKTEEAYSFALGEKESTAGRSMLVVDWAALLHDILADVKRRLPVGIISAKFHNALVEIIVAVARRAGHSQVALSGGCFQNRYLTERAVMRLQQEGFRPYWHQRIPPNDGGIALGQIIAALMTPAAA